MKKLVIVLLFITSCNRSNNVFILPDGFRGDVSLTYEVEGTQKNKVFVVPVDGKVYTSLKYESGFLNNDFYILDSKGRKLQLKEINKSDKIDCEELGVLYQRIWLNGNIENENSKYSYVFTVGTKNDLNWCQEPVVN